MKFQDAIDTFSKSMSLVAKMPVRAMTNDGRHFSIRCSEVAALRLFYYYRNLLDVVCLTDLTHQGFGPEATHLFEVCIEE